MKKWIISALLFSVAVNVSVLTTLIYFWKKNAGVSKHEFTWHQIDDQEDNDVMILRHLGSGDSNRIVGFKHEWSNQIDHISNDIVGDRQKLIEFMLKDPPDTNAINVVIDSMVSKQIQAEKYTIDHLLDIRELMPRPAWEDMVKSLNGQRKVIIHQKITTDAKKGKYQDVQVETIEIKP